MYYFLKFLHWLLLKRLAEPAATENEKKTIFKQICNYKS